MVGCGGWVPAGVHRARRGGSVRGMERRPLGNTDLMTSPIGFGTWEMSASNYGSIDVAEASRAVRAAIDHGINLFDTAEVYGPFHAEELLGKALGERRREVILVTKTGMAYDDETRKEKGRHSRYEHIIARSEGCLRRLNTDFVDLMLIHWPDYLTLLDEPMRALDQLKRDGKIRYGGVSELQRRDVGLLPADHGCCGESGGVSPVRPADAAQRAALLS